MAVYFLRGYIMQRLSAGTFFTLVLEARKKPKASQGDCFDELMFIIEPITLPLAGQNRKSIPSRFRGCDASLENSMYLCFGNAHYDHVFNKRIEKDYYNTLNSMKRFADQYLRTNTPEGDGDWLIYALLELIEDDSTIPDNAKFYINPDGTATYKSELRERPLTVYYYSFLLGVWHYACTSNIPLSAGRETFLAWTDQSSKTGTQKRFVSTIGQNHDDSITISYSLEKQLPSPATEEKEINISVSYNANDYFSSIYEKLLAIKTRPGIFSNYVDNAINKHSKRYTFLYENERYFRDFFVCNKVAHKIPDILNFDEENEDDELDEPIDDFSIDKIPTDARHILLLGTGGLGKSMMMNHLMLDTLERFEDKVPIFITLRNISIENLDLIDFIFSEFNRHDPSLKLSDLMTILKQGSAVLLFDGLDEVKQSSREKFDIEFDRLLDQYPLNYIVVSSRPGSTYGSLHRLEKYELMPFTLEQGIEMVSKIDNYAIRKSIRNSFIQDLKDDKFKFSKDEKVKFLGNPLLLTILLLAYENYHDIPTKRYQFYGMAYDALAQKHDAKKNLRRDFVSGLEPEAFKKLFAEFCAITYADESYSFTEDELVEYTQKVINANKLEISPELFIEDLTRKVCLLYLDGGKYYFIHRSFQEYFAAFFFSYQLEKTFPAIFQIIMCDDESTYEDETLGMLFGLAEAKTELYIIIPFLERLENKESFIEGYRSFLKVIYQSLSYSTGKSYQWPICIPASRAFNFIVKQYNLTSDSIIDDTLPFFEEFNSENIYEVNLYYDIPEKKDMLALVSEQRMLTLPPEYQKKDPAGHVCEFEVLDVYFDEDNKYQCIRDALENSSCPLFIQYKESMALLDTLRQKYAKNTEDSVTDFLSIFH